MTTIDTPCLQCGRPRGDHYVVDGKGGVGVFCDDMKERNKNSRTFTPQLKEKPMDSNKKCKNCGKPYGMHYGYGTDPRAWCYHDKPDGSQFAPSEKEPTIELLSDCPRSKAQLLASMKPEDTECSDFQNEYRDFEKYFSSFETFERLPGEKLLDYLNTRPIAKGNALEQGWIREVEEVRKPELGLVRNGDLLILEDLSLPENSSILTFNTTTGKIHWWYDQHPSSIWKKPC